MMWMRMPGQSWPGAALSFLGMWMVMMAAMMSPSFVPMLWRYRQAIQQIPLFGLHILSIDPSWLDSAASVSQQTGLLSNDAMIVAMMEREGLTNLASNDGDFDRVPGLTRFSPA